MTRVIETDDRPLCMNCWHWRETVRDGTRGRCQYAPPVVLMYQDGPGTVWPEAKWNDRCAKFKRGTAPNAPEWPSPTPSVGFGAELDEESPF